MSSRPKRRMKADHRRRQLLEVARRAFGRPGPEVPSLDDIAAEAGVTKPVLYQHFKSKQELYDTIVEEEMREIMKRMVPELRSGSPRETLENAAAAFLAYLEERPDGFSAFASQTPINWFSDDRVGELRRDFHKAVVTLMATELRDAGLEVDDVAPVLAHAAIGTWTYVGQWWVQTRSVPAEKVARIMASIAWRGIRSPP
ncbi:MAG: TetR/AcrR family transcriptional regulator [Myxococcota bacterium]